MKSKSIHVLTVILLLMLGLLTACQQHDHEYGEWEITTAATCTNDGLESRTCSCGEIETRSINATGHTFGEWVITTAATCTAEGVETRTCSCGEKETKPVNAIGHSFGDWVITTAATCTANGEKTRTCECGEKETETIAASDHNYAAATCKAPKTCSGCGATEGEPLPHQYTDGVCTVCEEVEPAEQQKRLFRGAYLFLTTAEEYCDLMSSMIYDAWYFAIYQADDYGTGSEAITAFSRNVGINTDMVTEAIDSYLTSLKYTPSDRYRLAALRTNAGALYVVDYALTKDEHFSNAQEAFATAKEKIKEMDPAYASDNGRTEITAYYDALYAYFSFCYSPSGSFSQLSGTVNTYRSNAETARNKCSWYWDM